jgi:hypothetical protein
MIQKSEYWDFDVCVIHSCYISFNRSLLPMRLADVLSCRLKNVDVNIDIMYQFNEQANMQIYAN